MDEPSVSPHRVTQLLAEWSHGDNAAFTELTPLVYEELRRLAHYHMSGQRPDHTLQTTALVNEAYLRLAAQTSPAISRLVQVFACSAAATAFIQGRLSACESIRVHSLPASSVAGTPL